jgi:hypothetical protein
MRLYLPTIVGNTKQRLLIFLIFRCYSGIGVISLGKIENVELFIMLSLNINVDVLGLFFNPKYGQPL